MASSSSSSSSAGSPKRANLLDHSSVKHLLDESVARAVAGRGYAEDVRIGNLRMLVGAASIVFALAAHFYPKKFPDNRHFLAACIVSYVACGGLLMFIQRAKQRSALLFTYPLAGSVNCMGLMISSKLPKFSDMYTLTVSSADPKSIFAHRPAQFTKSVTKWFTKDGYLVEGLLRKDVERLIDEYCRDLKKKEVA